MVSVVWPFGQMVKCSVLVAVSYITGAWWLITLKSSNGSVWYTTDATPATYRHSNRCQFPYLWHHKLISVNSGLKFEENLLLFSLSDTTHAIKNNTDERK